MECTGKTEARILRWGEQSDDMAVVNVLGLRDGRKGCEQSTDYKFA